MISFPLRVLSALLGTSDFFFFLPSAYGASLVFLCCRASVLLEVISLIPKTSFSDVGLRLLTRCLPPLLILYIFISIVVERVYAR